MTGSPASERRRPSRRRLARTAVAALAPFALVLAGCSSLSSGPGSADAVDPLPVMSITPAKDPLLIKHGWDVPTPAYVQANVAAMEQMPFDGLTVSLPDDLSSKAQGQTPISYAQFKKALAPMAATKFTDLEHNFVMAYSAPAGDLFDDWSVPAANLANLARAAKEAGLAGIFYDNEEYFGDALRYPANCADRTVEACQAQAQLRGEQVMDAMRGAWPDIEVITLFGAWISDPGTPANLSGIPYNDIAFANELTGPFVVGMVASAVDTPATVVDGGEVYTARTPEQFATLKTWQKQGMGTRSALVPASLQGAPWSDTVSAAFGVYDQPWIDVDMDVDTWRTTLANALAATDKYVWAYTERHNWWGGDYPDTPVPDDWVEATRDARATVPR